MSSVRDGGSLVLRVHEEDREAASIVGASVGRKSMLARNMPGLFAAKTRRVRQHLYHFGLLHAVLAAQLLDDSVGHT
jgi:hypothetical protein